MEFGRGDGRTSRRGSSKSEAPVDNSQGVSELDQPRPRDISRGGASGHRWPIQLSAGQDGGLRGARRERQGSLRPAGQRIRPIRGSDGPLLWQLPAGRAGFFHRARVPHRDVSEPAPADVRRSRRSSYSRKPARIRRLLRASASTSPRGDERSRGCLLRHPRTACQRGDESAVRLARGAARSGRVISTGA